MYININYYYFLKYGIYWRVNCNEIRPDRRWPRHVHVRVCAVCTQVFVCAVCTRVNACGVRVSRDPGHDPNDSVGYR